MRGSKQAFPLKITLPHGASPEYTSAEFRASLGGKVNRGQAIPEGFQGYFASGT